MWLGVLVLVGYDLSLSMKPSASPGTPTDPKNLKEEPAFFLDHLRLFSVA